MCPDPDSRSPRARLDLDHETLLSLLDHVINASEDGVLTFKLEEAILRFTEHFTDHAAGEQDLMHAVGYPSREQHAAAHDSLLQEVLTLLPLHGHTTPPGLRDRARALELSVQQHIITWDWNLIDFVRRVRPSAGA